MKKVEAIVKPLKFEEIRDALALVGVEHITVTEVNGFGIQSGYTDIRFGKEYVSGFPPRIKLEMIVCDSLAEATVQAISKAAKSGRTGGGKIFVSTILEAVHIRTEARGEQALAAESHAAADAPAADKKP